MPINNNTKAPNNHCRLFCKLALGVMCLTSLGMASNVFADRANHPQTLQHMQPLRPKASPTTAANNKPVAPAIYWQTITRSANRYHIPNNALALGYDKAGALYACNTDYNGGIHPGQYTTNGCLITFGGKDIVQPRFKLLLGATGHTAWYSQTTFQHMTYYTRDTNWGFAAPGLGGQDYSQALPVIGGYEPTDARYQAYNRYRQHMPPKKLYICRGIINNRIHLGKVVSDLCNVAYQNKEYMLKSFEVLFYHQNISTTPADSDPVTISG
jgi:hypothetical protein